MEGLCIGILSKARTRVFLIKDETLYTLQLDTDESIPSLSSKIYGPKNILRDKVLVQDKLSLLEHNVVM